MIQINAFHLLIAFLVIFVMFMMASGGRRHHYRRGGYERRRRHHRRRYDDDEYDDDYDDDYDRDRTGRDTGLGVLILFLVIVGIFIASQIKKSDSGDDDRYKGAKSADPTSQASERSATDNTTTIRQKQQVVYDRYAPPADILVKNAALAKVEYYVRINVLYEKNEIHQYCQRMIQKGLTVSTLDKKNGTAIYVGPFKTRERAEQANADQGLDGVIEAF